MTVWCLHLLKFDFTELSRAKHSEKVAAGCYLVAAVFSMLTLVSALLLLCGEQEVNQEGVCNPPEVDKVSTTASPDSFEGKMNEFVDKMLHSKMMEDLKALPSEVMEELKNLPSELRESLILHVERRSLVVAGVMVAIGAAVMLLGCLWIHWCHTEHGEYRYIPLSQVEEFLKYQKVSSGSHSHSSPPTRRHKHSGRSRHKHDDKDGNVITHRKSHNSHIANGGQ